MVSNIFLFSTIYRMSSFPLTNSYFSRWLKPPTSIFQYGGFRTWGYEHQFSSIYRRDMNHEIKHPAVFLGTSILGNPIYHINIPCTKLRVRTWNGQLFSGDLPSPYLAGSRSGLIYWRANVLRSTWRWAMDSHRLASSHRNFRISSSTWFIIILPIKRGRNLGLNVQTNIIHHWHHCWSHPIKSQSYLIKSHETQEFLLIFRQMSQVIPQHIPSSGWANGLDGNCRPRSSLIFPACRRLLLSWKKWKRQSGSIAVRCLADLQKWARSYRPRRFHHFFWEDLIFFGSWLSLPSISPMGCPKFDHSNASNVLILLGETFGASKLMCETQTL